MISGLLFLLHAARWLSLPHFERTEVHCWLATVKEDDYYYVLSTVRSIGDILVTKTPEKLCSYGRDEQ